MFSVEDFTQEANGLAPPAADLASYVALDHIVTAEVRPREMPRGNVELFYRLSQGATLTPLVYTISRRLLALPPGKLGIATGALGPDIPFGENDGPLGAVALAHVLRALGHRVSLLAEGPVMPVMRALAAVRGVEIDPIELDLESADQHAKLASGLDALICIEKAGINPAGVLHSMTGKSRDGTRAKIDGLVRRLREQGKLTIGIGDGGNEIGFGNLRERVIAKVPYGAVCACPCRRGILTETQTDYLYPVSVSNWGAYALVAAIAMRTRDLRLVHGPTEERRFLLIAKQYDCRDGQLGLAGSTVDRVTGATSEAVCHLLAAITDVEIGDGGRP